MIHIKPRATDNGSGTPPMRSDRFFAVNAYWFFATREGADIGPFETKSEAQTGLQNFIDFISIAPPETRDQFLSKYVL